MKKTVALMMAAIMLMAFVGCTGGADKPNAQDLISTLLAEGGKPVVTDTPAPTEAPVATEEPTAEPTAEAKSAVMRGTWEDGVFYNDLIGCCFTMPEGWEQGTDEEIAEFLGVSVDEIGAAGEDLSDYESVDDMLVYNLDTGSFVMISYKNMRKFRALKMTNEEIMEEIARLMVEENDYGITYTYVGTTLQKLGDADYICAEFDTEAEGEKMKQYILMSQSFDYVAYITIAAVESETLDYFVSMFTPAPTQAAMADCCG